MPTFSSVWRNLRLCKISSTNKIFISKCSSFIPMIPKPQPPAPKMLKTPKFKTLNPIPQTPLLPTFQLLRSSRQISPLPGINGLCWFLAIMKWKRKWKLPDDVNDFSWKPLPQGAAFERYSYSNNRNCDGGSLRE